MIGRAVLLAALCFWPVAPALAQQAPERSPRPEARDTTAAPATAAEQSTTARPPRPGARDAEATAAPSTAVVRAPRPERRPARPLRSAEPAPQQAVAEERPAAPQGALCGDPFLTGAPVTAIEGRIPACGIDNPVRVTRVAGLALSQPATLDCPTARALSAWVRGAVRPVLPNAVGLGVAAHYTCRTRNNQPGAKVSEHGRGRAIDISGFRMADGSTLSVLEGWRSRRGGPALRRLHQAACGPFGTVLGPAADRFHQDHFHFDTARYRSGSYCR